MSAWLDMINHDTGERRMVFDEDFFQDTEYEEANIYFWQEGNFSCDCNRALVWFNFSDEANDRSCGENRFSVVRAFTHDGRIIEIDGEPQSKEPSE